MLQSFILLQYTFSERGVKFVILVEIIIKQIYGKCIKSECLKTYIDDV